MRRTNFDTQLLRVFAFIVSVLVVVSMIALATNRYLANRHRTLIESNLPAASLARTISDESLYIATLAPTFSKIDGLSELRDLTDALNAELDGLERNFEGLAEYIPVEQEITALLALQQLKQAVAQLSALSERRLSIENELESRRRQLAELLTQLDEIVSTQTDIARVRVTAAIADLVENRDGFRRDELDRLADIDFFAFDRHVELSASLDRAGLLMVRMVDMNHLEDLEAAQLEVAESLDLAGRRLKYFPSLKAQKRADEILEELAREVETGGGFDVMFDYLDLRTQTEAVLTELPQDVVQLTAFSDTLLGQVQSAANDLQSRTLQLGERLSFGLLAIILLALAATIFAWQFARRQVVERLRVLAGHIAALGREEYDHAVPVSGDDEIGQMEKSLDGLRVQAAEARDLREELEETVLKRTGEIVAEMEAHDSARAAAEASDRAKSEFLARMSHEIRTPLNGVIGMLRLLEGETAAGDGRQRLTTARISAEHLLELTNDILDYSSTQKGNATQDVDFDLRELVGQFTSFLSAGTSAKGLAMSVDLAPTAPPALLGDVGKIRQVVINLLSNAVKYTDEGEVALMVDHAPNPATGKNVLSFAVADSGIGIEPEQVEAIFDAYRRSDDGRTGIEGIGLGLTISRRLTQILGGALTVESEPGVGSRFTLTVELAEGDIARAVSSREEVLTGALDKHVLLIEDNAVNRMVARGYLERLGCRVTEAETGAAGVAAVVADRFDLVLLDLDLPDIPGPEVARQIREALEEVPPLVALTAHRVIGRVDVSAELNMDAALEKPISPRQLAALLRGESLSPSQGAVAVDDATLGGLREDLQFLGTEETTEILVGYFTQSERILTELRRAIAEEDHAETARLAHRLKGAAANFRLTELAGQLAQIEAAARSEDPLAELSQSLDQTFRAASDKLRAAAETAGIQLSDAKR
ncbi:ATP-binding protein [Tropicimonas sp. TH_r6]|uniref:ATP-binding protein n=1 Tax=Tropicimonas sp. TH_r6 TaxID=3082085 RepID=UPI002952A552|nr:ATP-binding protein [Tropicimonas sp. TH_r6]MDV7145853.1 ATP-binding protein [Tropicimonas sp. TH_r6]